MGAGALKGVEFIKRWDSESPEGSKGKGKGKGGGGVIMLMLVYMSIYKRTGSCHTMNRYHS